MDIFENRLAKARRNRGLIRLAGTMRLFWHNKTGMVSLTILIAYILTGIIGPHFAPYNPIQQFLTQKLLPPSPSHIMGTDDFGRDIFSRILYAIQLDLLMAFVAISISYVVGILLGIVSGYRGKITDNAIMRVMDILFAFPFLIFAIFLSVVLGEGFLAIVIAVAVVSVPGFARVARSTVLSTKNELYVLASVSEGASSTHILFRHILPQAIAPTVVLYALGLGNAILVAAALSFLGVGIQIPTPELGAMIYEGYGYMVSGQWWLSVFPGIFIVIIVVVLNTLGDAIREVADVTLRR